ncbi:MAG: hypothetical protein KDH89_13600 [Anaerolineae bacterium]|nr:hypothetical protein [Anaerolineae bacterium]
MKLDFFGKVELLRVTTPRLEKFDFFGKVELLRMMTHLWKKFGFPEKAELRRSADAVLQCASRKATPCA